MPVRREEVEALLRACRCWRDRFLLVMLWFCGLRVGEALGLRRSDLHLVPSAAALGCAMPGPHLHVVARDNPNRARAKSGERACRCAAEVLACYDRYLAERDACPGAEGCDFVLVNLRHAPFGQADVDRHRPQVARRAVRDGPGSTGWSLRTCSATPPPPSCWPGARRSTSSKSCSGMPRSARPRSTCTPTLDAQRAAVDRLGPLGFGEASREARCARLRRGTAGNLGGDRLARRDRLRRCSSSVGWDPATRPWPRTASIRCSAIRSAGSPAASSRRGARAGCAPAAAPAFEASGGAGVEAFCAGRRRPRRTVHVTGGAWSAGSPASSGRSGPTTLCLSCDGLRRRRRQSVEAYVDGDERAIRRRPSPDPGDLRGGCPASASPPAPRAACAGRTTGPGGSPAARNSPSSAAAPSPCLGDRSGRVVLAGLERGRDRRGALRHPGRAGRGPAGHARDPAARGRAPAPLRRRQCRRGRQPGRRRAPRSGGSCAFAADRAGLVRSSLETEQAKDVWDLRLVGRGRTAVVHRRRDKPSLRRRPAEPAHRPAVAEGGGQGVGRRGATTR